MPNSAFQDGFDAYHYFHEADVPEERWSVTPPPEVRKSWHDVRKAEQKSVVRRQLQLEAQETANTDDFNAFHCLSEAFCGLGGVLREIQRPFLQKRMSGLHLAATQLDQTAI